MRPISALVLLCALACASCGSAPVAVAGTYTVNLTNGPNGCMVENWTEGMSTSGVVLSITQDGASFVAEAQGLTATYLDVVVGSHTFSGTISGSHLDATLRGAGRSAGSCAYSIDIDLDAELSGDLLTGSLRWYADTNSSPDCGLYATCSNTQSFNGTRPPR